MAVVISGDTGITSVNGTATAPSITGADTNTGIVYGTDTLSLATGGVAAVTIDSSQNVGIGTSSPANKFDVYDAASAVSSVSGDGSVFNLLARASSDSSGPQFSNQKFRGTIASPTVVASGDITGRWVCFGYDGTTLRPTSEIRSVVDGTPGSSDMPGRLVFYTTPDGSVTSTERGRFDSSGNFEFDSGYGSVEVAYGCRAWVNFNGAGTIGTNQTIRASGNISSVGHSAAGRYEINFATALPDTNYAVAGAVSLTSGSYAAGDNNIITPYTLSTSSCSIAVTDATSNTNQNPIIACIQITR
jgi:hypothetical protein